MALLEKHLFLKTSTLPEAGKGLFTKKAIPKGTRIVEYKGDIKTWNEVKHSDWDNRYIVYVSKNHVIDGSKKLKSFARYANDASGLRKLKGVVNNAFFINDENRIFIEAAKPIEAGQEIFVSYGKDYWDAIHHNKKNP